MELKKIERTLWVENGSGLFHLNDIVKGKICQILNNPDMILAECSLDDVDQHIKDDYNCFVLTVNRPDLVQRMYDKLNEHGIVLFVSTKQAEPDECDWKASSPCDTHYVTLDNLKIPITQDGIVVGLEEYKSARDCN